MHRMLQTTPIIILAVLVSGCSDRYKTYPVTGIVKFPDGSPLVRGQIYFETRDEQYGMGVSAMGRVNEDGTFSVGAYERDEGGVPPGRYTVFIRGAMDIPEGGGGVAVEDRRVGGWLIAEKFRNATTTDIHVDVKEEDNYFEIEVEAPQSR